MKTQKQNEIKDVAVKKISAQLLENLFNVYLTEDSEYFYNIIKTVNFPEDISPILFTQYATKPKDTWPLISYNFYNDVRLWWIVCSANNIINPVEQPIPGTVLNILKPDIVRDVLNKLKDA